ncbi:MAG: hypothetical protein KIT44_14190, partial [Opitutaceae bacterium]|nr:hypothetical protein [Opitutaceae bacterium]
MSHGPLAAPASPMRGWFVRFAAVYFALISLERLVGLVPAPSGWAGAVEVGLGHGTAWIGRQLVGITRDLSVEAGAISDTPVGWLRFALSLGIAAIAATVWLAMNRKTAGAQTDRIRAWLRLGLRYVLGPTLLVYGVVKLIPPTQFAYPTLFQLITPLGEASPQGLLWRFMGYSPV